MPYYQCNSNENKSIKVIKLGGSGTYDLTSYEGWQNFEVNKNIFVTTNGGTSGHSSIFQRWGYSIANASGASASYNNSTGALIVSNGNASANCYDNDGGARLTGVNVTLPATAYLVH